MYGAGWRASIWRGQTLRLKNFLGNVWCRLESLNLAWTDMEKDCVLLCGKNFLGNVRCRLESLNLAWTDIDIEELFGQCMVQAGEPQFGMDRYGEGLRFVVWEELSG